MLVLFVFFRIGGGDVKLLAMLGAFLGLEQGIETLLWTFVLGGAVGLIGADLARRPVDPAEAILPARLVDACDWGISPG